MAIAFLFPGQGSQEIGMGQDLFKTDEKFRSLVSMASDLTHENLETLCLRGPEKKLRKAAYLQPLLVAVSLGYFRYIQEASIVPRIVLGHSLGEITALAASGVVSYEQAILIASKRGEFMDEAATTCNGSMMAVLYANYEKIMEILTEMNMPDRIVMANNNAPDQVVVSGDVDALTNFCELMTEKKIGKCKQLTVNGPWHSPFMENARQKFAAWVDTISFKTPIYPLMLNATAQEETNLITIKQLVINQLVKPVFWRQCMESLKSIPIDTFLEIGPGRVLSGLVRINDFPGDTVIYNVNNMAGVQRSILELGSKGNVT